MRSAARRSGRRAARARPADSDAGRRRLGPAPQASGPGMRSALRGRLGQLGRAAKSVLGLACLALALGVALGLLLHQTPSATTPGRTSVAHSARSAASPPTERILPGETAYIVRRGDRLASIAARFHVSPGALMLVNADILKPKASLVVGTRLAIPAVYRPGVDPGNSRDRSTITCGAATRSTTSARVLVWIGASSRPTITSPIRARSWLAKAW